MADNRAIPALPRLQSFRPRSFAFVGNKNEKDLRRKVEAEHTSEDSKKGKEEPLAADGRPIRRLRDSIGYCPLTEEWYFRARRSSSSSTGSNRQSTGEEYTFAEELRARKASLGKVTALKEEAGSVHSVLTESESSVLSSSQGSITMAGTADNDDVEELSESSSSSSIEEVKCTSIVDPSVPIEYPFHKLPRQFVMEYPSSVPIVTKGEKIEQRKDLKGKHAHDHHWNSQFLHAPVRTEQHNCTRTLVYDRLPIPILMDERNNFDASPPPCLCTVHITNASKLLLPGAVHTYKTESILVPKSSKSKFGYKVKLIIQVSCNNLSLAIIPSEGDPGRRLPWPFNKTVLFGLENINRSSNREKGFKCYGNGENFKECLGRPRSAENTPIGIRHFISVQALRNGFINNDTLVMHCLIFSFGLNLEPQLKQLSSNKRCIRSTPMIHVF